MLFWFLTVRYQYRTSDTLLQLESTVVQERLERERETIVRAFRSQPPDSFLAMYHPERQPVSPERDSLSQPLPVNRRMIDRVRRGAILVEMVGYRQRPHWMLLAPEPFTGRVTAYLIPVRLQGRAVRSGYRTAVWLRGKWLAEDTVAAARFSLPQAGKMWRAVMQQEQVWVGRRNGPSGSVQMAAIPIKDYESWDVIGLLLLSRPEPSWLQILRSRWLSPAGLLGTVVMIALLLWLLAAEKQTRCPEFPGRRSRHTLGLWSRMWRVGVVAAGLTVLLLVAAEARHILQQAVSELETIAAWAGGSPPGRAALRRARFALAEQRAFYLGLSFLIWAGLFLFCAAVLYALRHRHRPATLRRHFAGFGFIAPAAAHLILFSLLPVAFAFYISFHRWSILSPERPFVGLANYQEVLGSRDFWNSLKNTALYTLHVPAGMAVSLMLALLLNRKGVPGLGVLRTIFYLPSITSFVAIAIVWLWIYNPEFGLLNYALSRLGLGPYPWLNDPSTALLSLMLMAIWIQAGYQMVIYLAGLQNIPAFLYEAAVIDGAGRWQRFRHITWPLLQPTTFFILVTSMIGSFQVFTQIYVMTEGGPLKATEVIVYYIYKNAWDYLRMGYASAMSFILFLIIMGLTLLQFKWMGRREAWEM